MSALTVSRILFVCLMINEAVVLARTPPEERKRIILPRAMPLLVVLLFLPLFFALNLPVWLGWLAVSLQALGLGLEIAGELQLMRAQSFSVSANPPAQTQTTGFYRNLENPIYVGILLQMTALSLWMPLTFIAVALQVESFRRMVREERKYLAQLGTTHRGADSFMWN
ncbi:methyltransferase [Archangium sp.]|jgi:protein-S-isoprenylcysteine O-methyltransferase Ste14|uniref:methyltransferase n=1 Tax=Archangium sp. TaxID=1872627 RepID=UPI002ED8CCE1